MAKKNLLKQLKTVAKAQKKKNTIRKRQRKQQAPRNKVNNSLGVRAARTVGRMAGNLVGMGDEGSQLFETGIKRLFGAGTYYTSGRGGIQTAPSFVPLDRVFRISHREYIRDVSTSTAFSSLDFALNPGIQGTFPWLSTLAPCFEKYKFKQLEFHLVSTSATAVSSTNTALGTWGAVTVSDPLDPLFTTKAQAENYQGAHSAVPACSIAHYVECKPKDQSYRWYFTRSGAVTGDLKTYDPGRFTYFAQGAQAASVAGELWVTYTVDFMVPKLPNGGVISYSDYGNSILPTAANPLGSSFQYNSDNNIGAVLTPTTITLPAVAPQGLYAIWLNWKYAAPIVRPASLNPAVSGSLVTTDCQIINLGTSNAVGAPASGETASSISAMVLFRKTDQTAGVLTFTIAWPSTGQSMEYLLTLVNSNLGSADDVPLLMAPDDRELLARMIQMYKKNGMNNYDHICLPDEHNDQDSDVDDIVSVTPSTSAGKSTEVLRHYKPEPNFHGKRKT